MYISVIGVSDVQFPDMMVQSVIQVRDVVIDFFGWVNIVVTGM